MKKWVQSNQQRRNHGCSFHSLSFRLWPVMKGAGGQVSTMEQINSAITRSMWRQKQAHTAHKNLSQVIKHWGNRWQKRWLTYGDCIFWTRSTIADGNWLQPKTKHVDWLDNFTPVCPKAAGAFGGWITSDLIDPQWWPERMRFKGAVWWVMWANSLSSNALTYICERTLLQGRCQRESWGGINGIVISFRTHQNQRRNRSIVPEEGGIELHARVICWCGGRTH